MGRGMTVTIQRAMQRLAPVGGPLTGRTGELDALRRAWADAAAGRCRVVLLAGEAGLGKTRLAAELADEVDGTGAAVLVGRCPGRGADPFHPLVEALGPMPAGERDRDTMLGTLAAGVAARARRTPMLVVLDDLHRADRSTLQAVRRLVELAGGAPLLIVGTYCDTALDRSQPLSEFLAAMLPRPGVERICLGGLSPEDLGEMVGDVELGRLLWRRSAGNPVWVAELLRPGALDPPSPANFDALVARRVRALGRPSCSFLQAAAALGQEFAVDVAAVAVGLAAERVPGTLKQVAAAGFIVEEPGAAGDTRQFVHDMVREAVERRLSPAARVALHLRLALALERLPEHEVPAGVLAWHFRAAAPVGGSEPALRHSNRAGNRAMEQLAWDEAAIHYGHALAAATGAGAGTRADLLLVLGDAQRLAGEAARARQAFLEAATAARSCSDGRRMARAALALGHVAAVWGADPELEAVAGEARAMLGQQGAPVPPVAPAVNFATESLYDFLDGVEEVDGAPEPVAAVARSGRSSAKVALLRARHVALAGPERVVERSAGAGEMVALAAATGDDELVATGLGWRLVASLELGDIERATADQAAHAAVARRIGRFRPLADASAWSAMRAMLDGRADDARSAATEAFGLAVEADDPEADASVLTQRWWLALEWGTTAELGEVIEACRDRASSAAGGGKAWRAVLALALVRAGHLDLAAEELRRATDHGLGELVRDPGRLHPLSCLAEVAWVLGDGYRAATVGPALEPFVDHVAVAGRALTCHGSVARACGMVAASARRWEEAERHFQSALAVHNRIGALPLLARTRFEWSTVLLERGRKVDRRRGAEWRRKAAELATRLGMFRLRQEIDARST